MTNRVESYTAASVYPVKVLQSADAVDWRRCVMPIHVQLNPTNACNLECEFCSCSARDKKIRLPFDLIKDMMVMFKRLGMKAVTITGGGEPAPQVQAEAFQKLDQFNLITFVLILSS